MWKKNSTWKITRGANDNVFEHLCILEVDGGLLWSTTVKSCFPGVLRGKMMILICFVLWEVKFGYVVLNWGFAKRLLFHRKHWACFLGRCKKSKFFLWRKNCETLHLKASSSSEILKAQKNRNKTYWIIVIPFCLLSLHSQWMLNAKNGQC